MGRYKVIDGPHAGEYWEGEPYPVIEMPLFPEPQKTFVADRREPLDATVGIVRYRRHTYVNAKGAAGYFYSQEPEGESDE